jgi:hypothetical protein
MSTDVITPTQSTTSLDPSAVAAPKCSACPHDLDQHDRISLRYCSATTAATMTRGCICAS